MHFTRPFETIAFVIHFKYDAISAGKRNNGYGNTRLVWNFLSMQTNSSAIEEPPRT